MTAEINFKPLQTDHLTLLANWLAKAHVMQWWNDHLSPDEIEEKYGERIHDPIVKPFIVYLGNKPIGFIQYYWASKVGEGWWPDEGDDTVGIDQFIGEEDYINKGFGTLMVKTFIQFLFQNPAIKKIITDVHPLNLRARRCYEKAGFHEVGLINTPDGEAVMMIVTKN